MNFCSRCALPENIKQVLAEAIVQKDKSEYHEVQNPRKMATEMAKQIVYRAMPLRKGAINVLREAYDRKDRIL
ncbi:MAG: hypothetical protein M3222_02410 [Thermoproteota archaeon]|nr:hypothetical protein [Thermoproteota archaeon]